MTGQIPPDTLGDVTSIFASLGDIVTRLRTWLADNHERVVGWVRTVHHHVLFDRTGWLPHYTTPFHLIPDDITDPELSHSLERYYRDNWGMVDAAFRRRLSALQIDDEAKSAFSEALDAHGAGQYRLVVRSVFPEIERVARVELLDGTLRPIASLIDVREAAGKRLGFRELQPDGGGPVVAQFGRMSSHLYERVQTPEDVLRVAADPIPNRHAALHGLVSYDRLQNSLNALIMAEFMLQVITALKLDGADRSTPAVDDVIL